VLLIIGGVRFVDMGLKAFVFTKADEQQKINYSFSITPPIRIEKMEEVKEEEGFTDEEKETIKQWLVDYEEQKEQRESFDVVASHRHRDASLNLSMILIGLPLYLYHWGIIRRETKKG